MYIPIATFIIRYTAIWAEMSKNIPRVPINFHHSLFNLIYSQLNDLVFPATISYLGGRVLCLDHAWLLVTRLGERIGKSNGVLVFIGKTTQVLLYLSVLHSRLGYRYIYEILLNTWTRRVGGCYAGTERLLVPCGS